jgi:hypothetical protein
MRVFKELWMTVVQSLDPLKATLKDVNWMLIWIEIDVYFFQFKKIIKSQVHIGRTKVSFRVSCCCLFSSHCWLIFYPFIGKFIVYWLNVLSIYIHSFVLKFSAHIHAHNSFMFHKFHLHIYIICQPSLDYSQ